MSTKTLQKLGWKLLFLQLHFERSFVHDLAAGETLNNYDFNDEKTEKLFGFNVPEKFGGEGRGAGPAAAAAEVPQGGRGGAQEKGSAHSEKLPCRPTLILTIWKCLRYLRYVILGRGTSGQVEVQLWNNIRDDNGRDEQKKY